jgi:cytoskeletal protein CcmA (bactofilin family)
MTHWHNDDPLDASHDTLVIDPVKMNIVNRIAEGSAVDGDLHFDGGLYVLGHLGGVADDIDRDTLVECQGTAYVASTGVSTGTLLAARLRMYDGAVLQGPFKTLRPEQSVPVLQAARNS